MSLCLFNLYAEYMMGNAGLEEAQLGSRLPGEMSITSDMQMIPPLWQKATNMAVAGQARLLQQPEYHDIHKAQRMLNTLDEDALSNLPAVMQNANGTKVLVGPENVSEELKDTSVVMTKFDIGDGLQGMIGVVGPTRMDYAKVTARLSYFAESLSKMFAKPEQPQLPGASVNKEA